MANIQSPPGLLSIYEALNEIGIRKLNKEIKVRGLSRENQSPDKTPFDNYQMKYTLYDAVNLSEMEIKLKKRCFFTEVNLYVVEIIVDRKGCNLGLKVDKKKAINLETNLDYIDTYKVMHIFRQLLSAKHLAAYAQHDCAYHKVPSEFWHHDGNWYRLLADGRLCERTLEESIVSSVYFKKKDIEQCLFLNIDEQSSGSSPQQTFLLESSNSLINLDVYTTPWLQVLAAIYDEFGKEKLGQVTKDSVESFIANYVKKHELDISKTDFPYLAKFMRLAEQKEGRKYYAKQKLGKLQK